MTRVTVAPQVYVEQVDDELVLLELETGRYFGLDAVAAHFWQLLLELGSSEAVARAAVEHYDVSLEQVTRDVDALVHELAERHLIVVETGATSAAG